MNEDQRKFDYSETDKYPRPSHADLTYVLKYGLKASSGGGRSSARETIGRVAAGAIAEKYLSLVHSVEIVGFVSSVGKIRMSFLDEEDCQNIETVKFLQSVTRKEVDKHETRCPEPQAAFEMRKVNGIHNFVFQHYS